MKIIVINSKKYGRHEVFVDDEDFDRINKFKWHLHKNHREGKFYARRNVHNEKRKCIGGVFMHNEIMGDIKPNIIDHIDKNGLNNLRSNFRICSKSDNAKNRSANHNSSSPYVGVSVFKMVNTIKWRAAISCDKKKIHIGLYDTQIEAAKARDKKAIELFGEFATLNFPELAVAPLV